MKTTGELVDVAINFRNSKGKVSLNIDTKNVETLEVLEGLRNKKLAIEIKEYRKPRSNDANAYFHVLVNELAKYFNISDTEMKIKMNLEYGTIATFEDGKIKGCKLPKGTNIKEFYPYAKWYKEDSDGCDCYIFYKQTHTLNSLEFSKLLNGIIMECKEVGIETKTKAEIDSMLKEWDILCEKKNV